MSSFPVSQQSMGPHHHQQQHGQIIPQHSINHPASGMMHQPGAPPPHMMMHPGIQQQQQHQQMMNMYHQQQMMMQHQIQVMAAQQQQQQAQAKQMAAKPITAEPKTQAAHEHTIENWHEGLDDEAAELFDDDNRGHEGIVRGTGIDELAAAWAEAEAEYEAEYKNAQSSYMPEEDEDVGNLWTGEMPQEEVKPYEFTNKEDEKPSEMKDWMEEGMQHFRNGQMKEAIKSFEMELQHNNPENSVAWRMLGRCYAESDQDAEAIKCLEAAVDRDPFSPESLLALGVSYVNELNHERALDNMKAWFTHNPKYAGMDVALEDYVNEPNTAGEGGESAFEEVKRLLLRALEYDPTDAADVHEALGVIYNVNRDYDAAVRSFRKALESRPDDYQLWNKLGATLANGNQSDQALPAYHRALEIKPKYARAWLNMAISHSNLKDHHEAARCYLQTLSLNPDATHCWTYLRMALSCTERWDLLPLVFSQDLPAFKEHFDFILEA